MDGTLAALLPMEKRGHVVMIMMPAPYQVFAMVITGFCIVDHVQIKHGLRQIVRPSADQVWLLLLSLLRTRKTLFGWEQY